MLEIITIVAGVALVTYWTLKGWEKVSRYSQDKRPPSSD
jgi:hypothetical protein